MKYNLNVHLVRDGQIYKLKLQITIVFLINIKIYFDLMNIKLYLKIIFITIISLHHCLLTLLEQYTRLQES